MQHLCSRGTYILGGRPGGGAGGCLWHRGGGAGWKVTCRHTRSPVRLHTGLCTAKQGQIHQPCSYCGHSCQGHPAPHPAPSTQEMQRCSHDSAHPSPSSAAEQSWAHTVGTGIELQAERASTALQGTLLPARAAIGPAGLCTTPAAASGCVVRAGETIKLQQAVKG